MSPWSKELPKGALLLGTLLPDLIDKPLYYGLTLITGKHGAELGLICGTRTFGHTAIFLLVLTSIAMFRRSHFLAALALGIASHLMLDNLWDGLNAYFYPLTDLSGLVEVERSSLVALLYPFYKARFSIAPFDGIGEHAARSLNALSFGVEATGAAILGWDWWKNRHESEIMQLIQLRRHLRRSRKNRLKQKH